MIQLTSTKKFNPLRRESDGSYSVFLKKHFKGKIDVSEYARECIDQSYQLTWGSGYMKSNGRDKSTKFKDSLKGKLGEFALYKHLLNLGHEVKYPDLTVRGKGKWDNGDIFVEGKDQNGDIETKKLSVKTAYYFSDLLLLKKEEWDDRGGYLYTENKIPDYSYKAFFFCRMRPNLDDVLPIEGDNDPGIENLFESLRDIRFTMEISGYINIEDFKKIIQEGLFFRKGDYIGKKKWEDSFYYCQSGDLREIDDIKRKKKELK